VKRQRLDRQACWRRTIRRQGPDLAVRTCFSSAPHILRSARPHPLCADCGRATAPRPDIKRSPPGRVVLLGEYEG